MLSQKHMRKKLAKAVEDAGGQKAWAEANGVSPQYVCDCLQGRRDIGESIAKAFGYHPITVYITERSPWARQ